MALIFENVSKSYGERKILDSVSFRLERGILLLIGPNGSGKSTFIKLAAGLIVPDSGRAWCGPGRVYIPEAHPKTSLLSARKLCRILGDCDEELLVDIAGRLGVRGLIDRMFRRASMGEARKLYIAAILAAFHSDSSKCMLVDEPFANIDAYSRRILWSVLVDYASDSGLMVVSTHVADKFMVAESDYVAAIGNGRLYVASTSKLASEVRGRTMVIGDKSLCGEASRRGLRYVSFMGSCYMLVDHNLASVLAGMEGRRVHSVDILSDTSALYVYLTMLRR